MEFLLQLYADQTRWSTLPPDQAHAEMGAYAAYTQALHDAGVFVAGERLAPPSSAASVRVSADGKASVVDGPYPETKEQLGGYYVIDVADHDAAVSWAARCPGASHGTVEVRPIMAVPTAA
jgi:hypothetical protein